MVQAKQKLQSFEIEVTGIIHPIRDLMDSNELVVNLYKPIPIT